MGAQGNPNDQGNSAANSDKGAGAGAAGAGGGTEQTQATQQNDGAGASTQEAPKGVSAEAYRKLQSQADKAASDAQKAAAAAAQAQEELRRVQRQAQLAGLSEADKQAVIKSWDLEDRERQLEEDRSMLNDRARDIALDATVVEFGQYGVTREALASCESPEAMRAKAAELKADHLQQKLDEVTKGGGAAGKPQQQTPAAMQTPPAGSGSGAKSGYDPDKYKGTGDLASAMRERREAGWPEEVVEVSSRGKRA